MGVSQGMEEEFVHKILRNLTLVGMIFLASMLSGCTIPKLTLNSEDLYSLPTLPAKYTELNTQLNEILESGAEYAAPTSGQTSSLYSLWIWTVMAGRRRWPFSGTPLRKNL